MKLGFNTAILPEYDFDQIIDFAAENGFACVEVACWPLGKAERRYAGVTHIDMDALDDAMVAHIKDYTARKNVFISAIAYYPNTLSGDPEQRAVAVSHLKKCIVGAERLGVGMVNTFIGRNMALSPEDNKAEFMSVWPGLIAFAEEHNVKIGIENCPMYYKTEWPNGTNLACNPAFWRYMFDAVKSDSFGLNYDPSHQVLQQMDYLKPIYNFADKIIHFHVKDIKFFHDKYDEVGIFAPTAEYHSPKLPGQGEINWGAVVSALNDVGYQGPVVLEIEDRAYESCLEDKLDSILLSRDFMRQFIRS